jgi:uncharacterized protein (TIGR02145 family)
MAGEITLTFANTETGQPAVLVGVEATLDMQLLNRTGADVKLAVGTHAAKLTVYFPVPEFFTLEQLKQMVVTADGWESTVDEEERTLVLDCKTEGTWEKDATLEFTISKVRSDGPPATGNVVVAPSNMTGVQLQVDGTLAVSDPPVPGNLKLPDVLQVSVDSQAVVYRSDAVDPLTNTLFLTIKNTGATALATDKDKRWGSPQISVSFVYGNTSGALAPDKREKGEQPLGSAWNIRGSPGPLQTAWEVTNPRVDGQDDHPRWLMAPSSTNLEILGGADSDHANVTFAFSKMVSLTPPGHTQMLVLFTGFRKDEHTGYNDHLFVIDIAKLDPPPTRGLLSFAGQDPVVQVTGPKERAPVALRWGMFDVAKVQLLTSSPAIAPLTTNYPDPQPLAYDETTMILPPLRTSEAVFMTLQSFDGRGGYLNSLQFTAFAQVSYVEDPGGHVYRIALIGETFWMLENYAYETTQGSYAYQDDDRYIPTYGRLYDAHAAQAGMPDGWHLPDLDDWNALIEAFGGSEAAYAALIDGGRSGYDARLGGWRTVDPDQSASYSDLNSYGYYWLPEGRRYAQFSGKSKTVTVGSVAPEGAALSVRYVRHA